MANQGVVWSPEALEDVEAIAAYIARDSNFYAAAVVEKMLVTAAGLSNLRPPNTSIHFFTHSVHALQAVSALMLAWKSLIKSRYSPSPNPLHPISIKLGINAHNWQFFRECLGDDQAVEGIAMVKW